MSFLRHQETHQPAETWFRKDCEMRRARHRSHALAHRIDESPVGYSLAGCSPAEPASVSPTEEDCATEGGRQQLVGVKLLGGSLVRLEGIKALIFASDLPPKKWLFSVQRMGGGSGYAN
jgi:hypothetical protein